MGVRNVCKPLPDRFIIQTRVCHHIKPLSVTLLKFSIEARAGLILLLSHDNFVMSPFTVQRLYVDLKLYYCVVRIMHLTLLSCSCHCSCVLL